MDALLVLEQNWPSEDRPSHGCPKYAESHKNSSQTSVLYISVMWFEGRFLISCSAAGHSVWEMIATNNLIFLCPAERCHNNCPPESIDNDELGVVLL